MVFKKEVSFLYVFYVTTLISAEPPLPPQYGVPPYNNNNNNNYNGYGNNAGGSSGSDYYQGGYDNNRNGGGVDNGGGAGFHDHSQGMSYEFGYQVKDDYSGNDYGRQEKSDGNQVTGEYRVHLPDGRIQIVTYYADWQSGFHADVRYEGEAQYPDQFNNKPNNGYNNNDNNNVYNGNVNNNNQFTPPSVGIPDRNQGGNQYGGYNYNAPSNNGYDNLNNVNDGINFGNYNTNRNKPINPVYGAP